MRLYEVLGVQPDASQREIAAAFRVRALVLHPDKGHENVEAFQALTAAYEVLRDADKRRAYDLTGSTDGLLSDLLDRCDVRISEEDIDAFAKQYKGSAEEDQDLIEFYNKNEGDIAKLFEYIPLSEPSEAQRFIDRYRQLIEEDLLEQRPKFEKCLSSLKKNAKSFKKREEAEKKRAGKDGKENGKEDSLVLQIRKNQQQRAGGLGASFLASLEEKYTNVDEDLDDVIIFGKNEKRGTRKTQQPRAKKMRK